MTDKELAEELLKRGVRIYFDACGCCNSPWSRIELDGVVVYDGSSGDDYLTSNNGFSSWEALAPPLPPKDPENDHRPQIDTEVWERYGKDESPVGTQYAEPPHPANAYRPGD